MAHILGSLDEIQVDDILILNADPIPADAGKVQATTWVPMNVMLGMGYMTQTQLIWFQDLSMRSIGVSGP